MDFFKIWVKVIAQPPKDFWNATLTEFWAAFYAIVPPQPKYDRDKLEAMVNKFKNIPAKGKK